MNMIDNTTSTHKILYVSGFKKNGLYCFIQDGDNSYFNGKYLTKEEFCMYDYSLAFSLMPSWLRNKVILFLKTGKYDEFCYVIVVNNKYVDTFISKDHSIAQAKKLLFNNSLVKLDVVSVNSHIDFCINNNDMNIYNSIEKINIKIS